MVKVGDIVKCYDFNGIKDCYMIGEVLEVEGNVLRAKLIKTVFEGKAEYNDAETFRAPLQGKMLSDSDEDPRVVVLG